MNSFVNPLTPLIPDPKGIDKPIQDIQKAIAAVPWIEKSFGRTWQAYKKDVTTGKEIVYPETWQGERMDLLNVMPNDNLNAQSFVTLTDPHEVVTFRKHRYSRMSGVINIIVWFNLKQLVEVIDYRMTELLKSDIQRALTDMTFTQDSGIEIVRIWEQADNVFRGFTIDRVRQQELIHPYGGFRFECALNYLEDCPPAGL